MIDIYVGKGMSKEDATQVITTMAKYKDFFVDVMMQQELELQVRYRFLLYRRRTWLHGSSHQIITGARGKSCWREYAWRFDNVSFICFLWRYATFGICHNPGGISWLGTGFSFHGGMRCDRLRTLLLGKRQEQICVSGWKGIEIRCHRLRSWLWIPVYDCFNR